jgi:eukaryotic-like serine/threonine-protein kinase
MFMVETLLAGRYLLEEQIATGGMGEVWRARDEVLKRPVAVKLLHDSLAGDKRAAERFRREALTAAQISHPNMANVFDYIEENGQPGIVMEYVPSETLAQRLTHKRIPIAEAVRITDDVLSALDRAHAAGIVHRDIKPANILLTPAGDVKVTDFGIARSLDVEHGVTQTGTVLGTGDYLAPEQASGEPVSPATDVYSLGVVLWELLTGEVPFEGENFVAVALRHLNEPVPSLREQRPDVPPRLAAAVEQALAKDPARRFPSMAAFAAELRACLAEVEGGAAPVAGRVDDDGAQTLISRPLPAPARRVRRRRPAALYAALALVVAGAAFAAVVFVAGGDHTPLGGGGGPSGGSGTPVPVHGVGDYDPQGNGGEPAYTAVRATDGSIATYWTTETYNTQDWGNLKDGLGLVLDAGRSVKLSRLTVTTPTFGSGFTARVEVGSSQDGPFAIDSSTTTVGAKTTFTLQGKSGRYWVVWLTLLGPDRTARISEVTAKS